MKTSVFARRVGVVYAALTLAACIEGQGLGPELSSAGHLSSPSAPNPVDGSAPAATPGSGAIVTEAGAPRSGGGARLLGQTREGAPAVRRLTDERPLIGAPIGLTVENAPIADAAAIILGDALGLAYVVDPSVSGTISFRADPPLPPQRLLETFRATLEGRGLSLTRVSGVFRVSSGAAEARGDAVMIPLRFMAAADIAPALELALPPEQIRAVSGPGGDALLVSGSPEEIDLARATVEALDIDAMSGNSVMLVGLEHAPAESLATELAGVFGGDAAPGLREGDGPIRAGGLRIVPLDRLGAVLLLARDGATLDRAFAWVRRLDRPRSADAQRLFVYRVQNRPAASLAESLNALFSGQPADGDDAPTPIQLRGEAAPRIVVDAEKNALVISAASRQFDTLVDLIRQLDSAPLQVLVETTILEVTLGDNLRYGVQYAFSVGSLFDGRDGAVALTNSGADIAPEFPGFAFTVGTNLGAEAIIEALDDVSDVTVISSPKLLVRDNQSATLQIGDQVPIVTRTAEGFDDTARIVNAVEYRDTGVRLTVTPRINSGGFVSMEVDQEVSTVAETTSSGIDSPTISRRSVTTDVTIQSGQTVVLGGLIQDSSTIGRTGIPVLDEIPVLGAAFGRRSQRAGRTELLALLRPHILSSPEQAEDLTERLRAQFDAISRASTVRLRQPGRTTLPDFGQVTE
ncbi:MAG: type II secretion system secretin GspD [Pseudomonadota bacterium]